MRRWLLRLGIGFALFSVGWHVFEFAWDQKLFTPETGMTIEAEDIANEDTERGDAQKIVNVGVKEAARLIEEQSELQVVDVRPESSFQSCRLPGARSVRYNREGLDEDSGGLDRDRPVLIYCDGGFRSRLALSTFKKAGFREIYHLHRGILSWRMLGMPCEKGSAE